MERDQPDPQHRHGISFQSFDVSQLDAGVGMASPQQSLKETDQLKVQGTFRRGAGFFSSLRSHQRRSATPHSIFTRRTNSDDSDALHTHSITTVMCEQLMGAQWTKTEH